MFWIVAEETWRSSRQKSEQEEQEMRTVPLYMSSVSVLHVRNKVLPSLPSHSIAIRLGLIKEHHILAVDIPVWRHVPMPGPRVTAMRSGFLMS